MIILHKEKNPEGFWEMRSFVLGCVRRPEGLVAAHGLGRAATDCVVQSCSQMLLCTGINFLLGWRDSYSRPVCASSLYLMQSATSMVRACMSVGLTITEMVVWATTPSQGALMPFFICVTPEHFCVFLDP